MFNKITDVIGLFRVGTEIANKGAWKQGGNAAALLAAVLMGAVKLLGDFNVIDIKLDTETATSIAGGIAAIVLFVVNNITSKSAGLLRAKAGDTVGTTDTSEQPVVSTTETVSVQPEPAKANPEDFLAEARAAMAAHHAQQFNDTNTGH
jgi:hypothetical protein